MLKKLRCTGNSRWETFIHRVGYKEKLKNGVTH